MRNSWTAIGVVGVCLAMVCAIPASAGQNDAARRSRASTAATAAAVIVADESWSCGMPNGIPNPESGTPVFDHPMPLDRVGNVVKTKYGRSTVAIVRGGDVKGTRLAGT